MIVIVVVATALPAAFLGTCGMLMEAFLTTHENGMRAVLVHVELGWGFLMGAALGGAMGFVAAVKGLAERSGK